MYGLGATIYHWITQNKPWDAPVRVFDDRVKPLREIAPKGYPRRWLESVDKALALKPRDRFQSIAEWQQALGGASLSAETSGAKPARWGLMLVILVALAGGGYGLMKMMPGSGQQDTQAQLDHVREEHQAEAARQAQQLKMGQEALQKAEADLKRVREEQAQAEAAWQQAEAAKRKEQAAAEAKAEAARQAQAERLRKEQVQRDEAERLRKEQVQRDEAERLRKEQVEAARQAQQRELAKPSFDCNKAEYESEHTVCSSPELSILDRQMANLYREVVSRRPEQRDQFRVWQIHWLRQTREKCQSDKSCLTDVYNKHIEELVGYQNN